MTYENLDRCVVLAEENKGGNMKVSDLVEKLKELPQDADIEDLYLSKIEKTETKPSTDRQSDLAIGLIIGLALAYIQQNGTRNFCEHPFEKNRYTNIAGEYERSKGIVIH